MNMNNQEKNNYVRTQITTTLLDMMAEIPFDKISISDLVSRAEVGRASFYRNYTDKNDVLCQESDRLMKEWGGAFKMDGNDNTSETLISFLDFLKAHKDFYSLLYRSGHDNVIREAILSQFPVSDELPNIIAYLTFSMGYMTYGWVHEWIKRGMQESGTELAQMFEATQKKS
ncbi:MAG: TetR family transcriptional regulator C-terminal domain-containing protein [Bacillota bacterium]|nr:TetR family transcriptional regulator C-terminal domain-containing protein [Bacillota bacterium]